MTTDFHLRPGPGGDATPIRPLRPDDLSAWLEDQPAELRRWVTNTGFTAEPGTTCLAPGEKGEVACVLLGVSTEPTPWDWGGLPTKLPAATYRVDGTLDQASADAAALGWGLGAYRFERYRNVPHALADLIFPDGCDRAAVERAIAATYLARDLVNTPADDMGPEELAVAAEELVTGRGGTSSVIIGDDLLAANYPAVHAVGRASARAPRFIDLKWGNDAAPRVTLVGKGVCFDSGGLDLKPASAMKLMKKDMGGAATVLGIASMVMAAGLDVRLRVLIPAVENSIAGNAFRPLDVVRTRKGLTVEIGNTDAEGRVILADALAEAAEDEPVLLIDCATLTGSARVALGTELPAVFTPDDNLARDLLGLGQRIGDPLWRLPLWAPYRRHLDSKIADLNNAPDSPFAGAITAALFLAEFAAPVESWAHIDLMAWNTESRPGRPEGGEAMAMRAIYAVIEHRFGRRKRSRQT